MRRIKKAEKIKFANSFIKFEDGFRALREAGLPEDLQVLQQLLSDKFVNEYADKCYDLIEIAEGTTKAAHLAKLQELFEKAIGKIKTTTTKITVQGKVVKTTDYNIDYSAAAKLSDSIQKLAGWGSDTGDRNIDSWGSDTGDRNIDIDLQLGEAGEQDEQLEKEEERENKTFQHFRKEGLL